MQDPTHRGARRHVPLLVLGALTAAVAPARAQVELEADPVTLWNVLHDVDEALTKGLAADVDRDGRLDLVQLAAGGYVTWSSSPAERQHRRVLTLGGAAASAVDVARLRADAGDALLTAGAHGVRRFSFDAGSGQFAATVLRTHPSGFLRVSCADRITGPYCVAYAIAGDGRTVYPMLFHAASGQEVFPLGAFDLGTTAGTIAAFDLQGDGIAELAVVTASSLTLRSYNGTTVATYARSSTQSPSLDRLAVLHDVGSAADRLAWVSYVGGQTQVRVLSSSGLAPALGLGSHKVLQASSGDLDGDGLADLVLALEIGPRGRWLRSIQSGTPRFSIGGPDDGQLQLGPAYAQINQSNAALGVGDFDRDGDVDVTLASNPSTAWASTFTMFRGQTIDHTRQHPVLHSASAVMSLGGGEHQLLIVLEEPMELPAANALRWRVWRDTTDPLGTAEDAPILTGEYPLPSTWPHLALLELESPDLHSAAWTVAFELVHTQGPVAVIRPCLVVVAAAQNLDHFVDDSLPGSELWGGPVTSPGVSTPGAGGIGQVPRIPPPPIPPAPPEPLP